MAKLKEKKLLKQPRSLQVGDLVTLHPSVSHLNVPGEGVIVDVESDEKGQKICKCVFSHRSWELRRKARAYTSAQQLGKKCGEVVHEIEDKLLVYKSEAPGSWTERLTQTEMSMSRFHRLGRKK